MKLLRIFASAPFIETFDSFYKQHSLDNLSYSEAIEVFKDHNLLYRCSFSSNINKLGYRCFENILDCKNLQKKWCLENNISIDITNNLWFMHVLKKQIEYIKPEILFLDRSSAFVIFYYTTMQDLKKEYPFIKLICGFWGSQITFQKEYELLDNADLIFCQDNSLITSITPFIKKPTYVLPHCFDISEKISKKLNPSPEYDFTFLGTSGFQTEDQQIRYIYLSYLLNNSNLEIWCRENNVTYKRLKKIKMTLDFFRNNFYVRKLPISLIMTTYPYASLQKKYPHKFNDALFGFNYFNIISQSKVSFNTHCDLSGHIGNMRCYEITGLGSCMLVDKKNLIKELFIPDEEIVCYDNIYEAKEKADFLLNNETIRKEIALKGQQKTLNIHNMKNRCIEMNDIIKKHF